MDEYQDEYADQMDDAADYSETTQEIAEAQADNFDTFPQSSRPAESILTWFWRIVKLKDSTKVANLSETELGNTGLTVRGIKRLALVCDQLGENKLQKYFNAEAEIITSTSMSKRGWLVEQSISQKKQTSRSRVRSGNGEGWRLYQKQKPKEE